MVRLPVPWVSASVAIEPEPWYRRPRNSTPTSSIYLAPPPRGQTHTYVNIFVSPRFFTKVQERAMAAGLGEGGRQSLRGRIAQVRGNTEGLFPCGHPPLCPTLTLDSLQ